MGGPQSAGYVSAISESANPHQVRCAAYLLRPSSSSPEPYRTDYFWPMLENDAAFQLNLAWSRQKVKRRNKKTNNSRLLFKIKHSVLTPAHKSQKRDKHKLSC